MVYQVRPFVATEIVTFLIFSKPKGLVSCVSLVLSPMLLTKKIDFNWNPILKFLEVLCSLL